jgi:hypothetical protein
MSVIIDIADAVTTRLNAGGFSLPFTAVRTYRPEFELADMDDLHVTVVPAGIPAMDRASRALKQRDYRIDVAVQKKFATGDGTELDPLMDLVEEIVNAFDSQKLAGCDPAICVAVSNAPVFAPEHMEEYRQFTSIITLTFRVIQ